MACGAMPGVDRLSTVLFAGHSWCGMVDMSQATFGTTLRRLRRRRGLSQLALAAALCSAAGSATVTRHEVSRWERGQRVPGPTWLSWLAVVLDTTPAGLAVTAAAARPTRRDLAADLVSLGEQWLHGGVPAGSDPAEPDARLELVGRLRRMDDLVGGVDLLAVVRGHWHAVLTELAGSDGAARRGLLLPAAELAQLAGWCAADAGDLPGALTAYRSGLALAAEAGAHQLTGYLLASASHTLADSRPAMALTLARQGAYGLRRWGSPGLRGLLAQRAAYAAARLGDRPAGDRALLSAQRAGERAEPDREPPWLRWLDDAETAAMTGRTLAALDRPLRALPLLETAGSRSGGPQPRRTAIYAGWLARALLAVGERERACQIGGVALVEAVRSGSARAAAQSRQLAVTLTGQAPAGAAHRWQNLVEQATSRLPVAPSRPTID
jgi:transcriptional regulator with XRE-family HTH domain